MKIAVVLLLLLPSLCFAQPATVARAVELKKEPASDAPTVASLSEGAKVDAGERKGGWTRVKAETGVEGWVKMLILRYAAGSTPAAPTGSDGGAAQLLNAARGGSSGTQVTTGVRGLDADQLANARPNPAELSRMAGYAAARDAAAAFALEGPLQSQSVDYPPEAN